MAWGRVARALFHLGTRNTGAGKMPAFRPDSTVLAASVVAGCAVGHSPEVNAQLHLISGCQTNVMPVP